MWAEVFNITCSIMCIRFFFLFRISSIATIVIVLRHYYSFSLLFAFSIRVYIVYVRS